MATRTYTRRTLAATLAAVPAAAVAGPLPGEFTHVGNDDAELIRFFELWKSKVADFNTFLHALSDEEFSRWGKENADLEFQIYAMPAKTLQGLRVKAEMAQQYAPS